MGWLSDAWDYVQGNPDKDSYLHVDMQKMSGPTNNMEEQAKQYAHNRRFDRGWNNFYQHYRGTKMGMLNLSDLSGGEELYQQEYNNELTRIMNLQTEFMKSSFTVRQDQSKAQDAKQTEATKKTVSAKGAVAEADPTAEKQSNPDAIGLSPSQLGGLRSTLGA